MKRFVVPRIAPRLGAGAPGAPDAADCAFRAVFVLVVEEFWLEFEPAAPEEDDEGELVDDELVEDEPLPIDFVPPPP